MKKEDFRNALTLFHYFYNDIKISKKLKENIKIEFSNTYERLKFEAGYRLIPNKVKTKKILLKLMEAKNEI